MSNPFIKNKYGAFGNSTVVTSSCCFFENAERNIWYPNQHRYKPPAISKPCFNQAIFSKIIFKPINAKEAQNITPAVIPATTSIASLRDRLTAVCDTRKKSGPGVISAQK